MAASAGSWLCRRWVTGGTRGRAQDPDRLTSSGSRGLRAIQSDLPGFMVRGLRTEWWCLDCLTGLLRAEDAHRVGCDGGANSTVDRPTLPQLV